MGVHLRDKSWYQNSDNTCLIVNSKGAIERNRKWPLQSCPILTSPPLGEWSIGIVICYVFPVLWMTSHLHLSGDCSTSPSGWGTEVHMQPWTWHVGIRVAGSGRWAYYLQSGATRPQWACWIFMTSCLHRMSLHIWSQENVACLK